MSKHDAIYFYKMNGGMNIPILSSSSTNFTDLIFLSDEEKQAIMTDFPKSHDNLFVLIDGTEFKLA